ncbi:MAG: hypothetical protein JNK72_23355 [Myxococcales bacterium]|nr:hypothetical protein [Myxococcales bacterium]
MRFVDALLRQPGFSPAQLVIAAIMYLAWTAAYFFIIVKGFRDKSYGVPWASLMLNIVWEALFSFELTDARLHPFFLWGNRLWLVFDVAIVYQFFRYGREAQPHKVVREYFLVFALASLVFSAVGLYTFIFYFEDRKGVVSSMFMNLSMGVLYIFMHLQRPDDRGMSAPAAWLKMIGTAAGSVFLYTWWPAQFVDGHLRTHPEVAAPRHWGFTWFLYAGNLVVDGFYLFILWRMKQGRKALPSVERGG